MAYLAIARKYRPATFEEIVGQDHVTRTLRNAIERDRVHHAFLFTGARGVGKTTAARALAKALNCEQGPTATPCGTCTSCVEVSNGTSPDLIEIDGASNNSVEDIRDLRDKVRYAPTGGRWKIYLVDEVHMLSKGAFNALLKTLEEPPSHVVFIFATTEPNRIPDTILSRVMRFDFKRIPVPAVVGRLRDITASEGVQISDNALRMIARAGEGSMRDAQSLLDQVISFTQGEVTDAEVAETLGLIDRELLYDFTEGLVRGEPDRCLDAVAHVYDFGHELSVFTEELLEVLRNATFVRLSAKAREHVDLPGEEVERLMAITEGVAPELLTRQFSALVEVHDQVSRSARPRVVLEMAVARLATIREVQPVAPLVGRLEALERRLRQQGAGHAAAAPRRSLRPGRTLGDSRKTPSSVAEKFTPSAGARRGQPAGYGGREGVPPEMPPTPPPPPERVRSAPLLKPGPAPQRKPEPQPRPRPQAEAPAPPPSQGDAAWTRCAAELRTLGTRVLHTGTPHLQGDTLKIGLDPGPQLAKAQLDLELEGVDRVLARGYPQVVTFDVVARGTEHQPSPRQLARMVMEEPSTRRVIDTLGARIRRVRLTDGER